jgi:hypothetical protein
MTDTGHLQIATGQRASKRPIPMDRINFTTFLTISFHLQFQIGSLPLKILMSQLHNLSMRRSTLLTSGMFSLNQQCSSTCKPLNIREVYFKSWLKYRTTFIFCVSSKDFTATPMPTSIWCDVLTCEHIENKKESMSRHQGKMLSK